MSQDVRGEKTVIRVCEGLVSGLFVYLQNTEFLNSKNNQTCSSAFIDY